MPKLRGARFAHGFFVLAALLFAIRIAGAQGAAKPDIAPFPVPPQQAAPWTPPKTTLMPLVVGAIDELFKQGLPDPRGCDYREVTIGFKETDGYDFKHLAGTTKTNGWVIPGSGREKFVICWNGVIYPVMAVGPRVDLRADVRDEIKKDGDEIAVSYQNATAQSGVRSDYRDSYDDSRDGEASLGQLAELHAAFLLRLGDPRLAEAVWAQWFFGHPEHSGEDPYAKLAIEWVGPLFRSAVNAHQRGDDARALLIARTLTDLRPRLEAEANRRQLSKPPDYFRSGQPRITYFPFLIDLPYLLADQERRHAESPYIPVSQMVPPPQGKERIALLIRDLELVYAPSGQWGQITPGIDHAPIVRDLASQGDAAIGPLLDCLQNDRRLTRSMDGSQLIEVDIAAYAALCQILHIWSNGYPQHLSPIARQSFVDQIRFHWKAAKK